MPERAITFSTRSLLYAAFDHLSTDVCSQVLTDATSLTVAQGALVVEVGENGDGESGTREAQNRVIRYREARRERLSDRASHLATRRRKMLRSSIASADGLAGSAGRVDISE